MWQLILVGLVIVLVVALCYYLGSYMLPSILTGLIIGLIILFALRPKEEVFSLPGVGEVTYGLVTSLLLATIIGVAYYLAIIYPDRETVVIEPNSRR